MKSVRFVCCFVLVDMLVLAQSVPTPLGNQPNSLTVAQEPHLRVPPNLSHMPQRAPFAQGGVSAFKPAADRRRPSPMQGLDFANAVPYGSGGQVATWVAVADVNGDRKPDIVVANEDSDSVGVLLGNGDGTFAVAVAYDSGGLDAFSVAVADVNGDRKPDIVVANVNSGTVGVLLGNGDGTFQKAVTYFSGALFADSVAVRDVNGDGKPDIEVAVNTFFDAPGDGSVSVLLGNGDGTFQMAVTYASGGTFADSVAAKDVNGDGKPDLVVSNCGASGTGSCADGTVGVLLGNGDGTFQTAVPYGSGGSYGWSVAVADVNGDGKRDIVVANLDSANAGVLLGNGDGTFQTAKTYGLGGYYENSSVAVMDVNGDGKPDILVANGNYNSNGTVGVLLGNGDGTFQTVVTFGSGGFDAFSVAVADVNGDGKPDLVVSNVCGTSSCANGSVGVLINTSTIDTTPPIVKVSADPTTLWPPNGKMVRVTISGTITDSDSGVNTRTARYTVVMSTGGYTRAGT